ncbi:MAG: SDR family oxidoreductase [Alphaproteobacteria bacterium]|nr:SDR family oxidoreductase [Alphaproteobacteria bacterium]
MDLKLKGRRALVTGGSKGIGLAIGKWFAGEGVEVVLVARSAERLEAEAAGLRKMSNAGVKTFAADLAQAADRDKVVAAFPDIDILVNNAGAIPGGALEDVDDPTWRAAWDLKVFGYINLTRAYLARMKAKKRGVIINIIGLGGEKLDYNYIAGSMGNASLMAFTRAIGGTSPEFGVRVIGINPGPVLTERIEFLNRQKAKKLLGDENRWREYFAKMPFARPANPDEIAATAVFLASDLASYTSGTIVTIDGGLAHRSGMV